jgi:hypothetical protein
MVLCVGITGAFAEDTASEAKAKLIEYINQAKVQEYVRALVQLKLKLMNPPSNATGEEIVAIREQVASINRELLTLAIRPLQVQKKELEKTYEEQKKIISEQNPQMAKIKDGISRIDLEVARAKAELVDSMEMK